MSRVPIAVVLIVVAALMAVSSVVAQPSQPRRTSSDIQAKVQKSAELQRQALQTLTEPEGAERLIGNAYVELQAAMSAMLINASGQKTSDPLLKLNEQRMRQALARLQHASDVLKVNRSAAAAPGRQEGTPAGESGSHLAVVRNSIEEALRITSTVFVF